MIRQITLIRFKPKVATDQIQAMTNGFNGHGLIPPEIGLLRPRQSTA